MGSRAALLFGISAFALLAGVLIGVAGTNSIMFLLPLLVAAALVVDWRVGVIFVAFTLPYQASPLLPQAQGFNPISYATFGALLILIVRAALGKQRLRMPPLVFMYCLVLPVIVGGLIALPYLHIGARNMMARELDANFETFNYLKKYVVKSLLIVVFAFLLGNAVAASKKPERFVTLFALVVSVPVVMILVFLAVTGVDIGRHRVLINELGIHYNALGKLMAFSFGPLLYVAYKSRGRARLFFGFFAAFVLMGVVLTFARGGYVAIAVTALVFVWQQRKPSVLIFAVVAVAMMVALAPDAVRDRALTGLDTANIDRARSGSLSQDPLTAGRVGGWALLAPEVLSSPLWGKGVSATAWSDSVSRGLYEGSHPHNMYLGMLLDVGLIGFGLSMYLYYRIIRELARLAADPEVPERLRAFFAGSQAAFLGMLVLAMTGGFWYPDIEQSYMWFAFGLMFAYWRRAPERRRASVSRLSNRHVGVPRPVASLDPARQPRVGGARNPHAT